MTPSILHIAPINVAGVPYSMMDMQRRFGHPARLITLHSNPLTFQEDICLNLPLPRNSAARWWRSYKRKTTVHDPKGPSSPTLRARNPIEKMYFWVDDWRRRDRVLQAIRTYDLDAFDVIHYDGGRDFFRDGRIAKAWKAAGKKLVCHYMGSDLRVRGLDPVLDRLSNLNLTNESDHLHLHPDIHYLYIPFDASTYEIRQRDNERLRILHSPTNRLLKGTHLILPVLERLKKLRNIEIILAERMTHSDLLNLKASCDIAIEQIGNLGGTGYGRNSLETLAMGIPTITEMTPEYRAWLPENPFVLATKETLLDRLIELIDSPTARMQLKEAGRKWVERYHSYESVYPRLMTLYEDHGIV